MIINKLTNDMLETLYENIKKDNAKGNLKDRLSSYIAPKRPSIIFTTEAKNKMWALVDCMEKEIGWHGVVYREGNTFIVSDILVYPQTVTRATIDADEKGFTKWLTEYMMKDDDTFDHIRLHGHSHVNMQCFPSGTDTKLQEDYTAKLSDGDYYIFIIVNKKREFWCAIYDNASGIYFEKADIDFDANDQTAWAEEQIKKYIKEPTYVRSYPNYYSNYKPYRTNKVAKEATAKKKAKQKELEDIILTQYGAYEMGEYYDEFK